jgi:anti-anti-sigma regulatory factor
MTNQPKIAIATDGKLIVCEYRGRITAAEMKAQLKDVDAISSQLLASFTVLVDLTGLEFMDPECAPLVSSVMDKLNALGAARVVRVIPDPHKDIGFGILSLFHYKKDIKINTVSTRAEATRLLK